MRPGPLAAAALLLAAPAAEAKTLCCGAKLAVTFMDAGLEIKLLSLTLWITAALVVFAWVRGARAVGGLSERTLAFLRGWRTGGPLLALAGVGYLAMNFFVAVYAYPPAGFRDYAPGLAEMAMVLWAGALTGGLAALAYADLSGRIKAGRFRGADQP
jgi:hypothetical protein